MTEAGAPVLSVVVPAYNEAARIAGSLERISGYLMSLPYDSELIVVDDGSDEAGRKAVEDAVAVLRSGLTRRLIRHETNRGKGAAVRSGCLAAHGRYVAFLDADLATPPKARTEVRSRSRARSTCRSCRASSPCVFRPRSTTAAAMATTVLAAI
jgi:glycosyltransferase involved in cell wall biosynthesis